MKKNYVFFILMFAVTSFVAGQTINNADFENWTDQGSYFDADDWDTPNPDIAGLSQYVVEPDDASPQSGSYCAYLETKNMVGTFNMAGTLTTGDYVSIMGQGSFVTGGVPFTDRPESLKFYYKCAPAIDDNCYVGVQLLKDGNIVAEAVFTNDTEVSSWTEVILSLTYNNFTDIPDTMNIIISSSDYVVTGGFIEYGEIGSKLWVDNFSFEGSIGIEETDIESFQIYPNPATSKLFIDFPDKKINKIEILSATGQVISTYDIDNNKQIIVKVDELISGIYFIKLSDGESVWIKQFIIY